MTTTAGANNRSTVTNESTTHTSVSMTTETTIQSINETHGSTKHSSQATTHTSAAPLPSTATTHKAITVRPQPDKPESTTHSRATVTSFHQNTSTITGQTTKTVKDNSTGTTGLKTTNPFSSAVSTAKQADTTVSTKNVPATPITGTSICSEVLKSFYQGFHFLTGSKKNLYF